MPSRGIFIRFCLMTRIPEDSWRSERRRETSLAWDGREKRLSSEAVSPRDFARARVDAEIVTKLRERRDARLDRDGREGGYFKQVLMSYKYILLKYLEIEFPPSWLISSCVVEYYTQFPTKRKHSSCRDMGRTPPLDIHLARRRRGRRRGGGWEWYKTHPESAVHYFDHQSLSDGKRRGLSVIASD
jgi:hypothetical protein